MTTFERDRRQSSGACHYFSMDVSVAEQRNEGMLKVVFSRSILLVYLPLLVLIGLSSLIAIG